MTTARAEGNRATVSQVLSRWSTSAQPRLAREVFGVTAVLDEQGSLRRALTDPAHSDDHRVALARKVFDGRVSREACDVLEALMRHRWSGDRGLADALEAAGVFLTGCAAENRAGAQGLEHVVDDLLSVQALLDSDPNVQRAFTDARASDDAKMRLLGRLGPTMTEEGRLLAEQAVTNPRGALPQRLLGTFADHLAALRERWIARVTTSIELDRTQQDRLRSALARVYGRDLKIVTDLDRSVVGGLRIAVGDEVIDGSVATRLNELQLKLGA
ncbi:MAG: F0F1 ATP synthase subunit delta [Kocuria sp.]|nr:F0F1 ATP synthase subunit delta [Kocuria sp.]